MAMTLIPVSRTATVDDQRAMMVIFDLAMYQWTAMILETEQIEPQSRKQVTSFRERIRWPDRESRYPQFVGIVPRVFFTYHIYIEARIA